MRKILLSAALIALAASSTFAATPKRLASITETERSSSYVTTLGYDAEGRLTTIDDSYSTVTINYSAIASGKITMDYVPKYGNDRSTYTVTINEIGLATSAVETDNYGDTNSWEFGYSDGKLISITVIDGRDKEYTDITWEDDLITTYLESESYDSDRSTATFTYSGVANTGNLALFDDIYGFDLDELEYLAMEGYFGAIPRELPTGATYKDEDGTQTASVSWELDAEGYPIKLSSSIERGESTSFAWEADNTGVESVAIDANGPSKFFTIDGRQVENPSVGLFIERKADGSSVKRIIR